MKFEMSIQKPGFTKPRLIDRQHLIDAGYTIPTLITGYGAFYYACDRDPTGTEPDIYTGYPDFLYSWWNQTSGQIWWCQNNTVSPLQWNSTQIGMQRNYSIRTSPAFNTSYTPNTMLDTLVVATVSLGVTLLLPSQINAEVDTGSGFVTVGYVALSGLTVSGDTRTMTFLVPANAAYKIVNVSGGGNNSLISLLELTC
jgi:hypothetical protein